MSTAGAAIMLPLDAPFPVAANRGGMLLWGATLAILVAFFLGVHDVDASKHWLKTEKGELNSLAENEASGRVSRQIGFLLLGAVGIVLLARPGTIDLRASAVPMFVLSILLVWAIASAAWSADVAVSLKREVVLVCMLLAAAGLIKHFNINQLAAMTLWHSLIVLILGVTVEFVLQPAHSLGGEEYRFAGTLHPNHQGINAAQLLLACLFFAHERRDARFYLIAAVAVVALVMTKSRTALSSGIVGSLVFVFLAFPPRKRVAVIAAILLITAVTMVIIATDAFSSLGQTVLMNRANSDPTTLTGRTMIWQFALDRVRDDWGRMIAGFGYGGFWTAETAAALSQRAHFALAEGHNAYLDVMLQLGLIGLGLYLFCILSALRSWISSARTSSSGQAALAAAFICFALNHHLAESALIAPTFPTLILWCVMGMAVLDRRTVSSFGGLN